jgi:hypothetical protein
VQQRPAGLHRILWVIDGRLLLVFHIDETHRFFRRIASFGGDSGNAIADKADHVPAENRHVADLLSDIAILRVFPSNDGFDSGNAARFGNIDAEDFSVRVRAAEYLSP